MGCQFYGHCAGQVEDTGLRAAIADRIRSCSMSRRRRDIDNRSRLLPVDQTLGDATATQKRSGENDIDRTVPILEIDGEETTRPTEVECVVDQQIDDSESRLRSLNHAVHSIGV